MSTKEIERKLLYASPRVNVINDGFYVSFSHCFPLASAITISLALDQRIHRFTLDYLRASEIGGKQRRKVNYFQAVGRPKEKCFNEVEKRGINKLASSRVQLTEKNGQSGEMVGKSPPFNRQINGEVFI